MIELRLHGVQPLTVDVERLDDVAQHMLQTIESLIDCT